MPSHTPIRNGTDGGEIYVATQQKAIYNWYQSRHSDDEVVDIYSPRWQERITDWYVWYVNNVGPIKASTETVKSWRTLEEIDLRVFFFAHPVATFSLWHVLQAFYEIDESICGTASDAQDTLAKWRQMKPFEYLKSKAVKRRWEIELKKLDKEIEYGALAGEELKVRIFDIQDGVEKLEVSLASLEQDMDVGQGEIAQADEILTFIRNTIDGRCNLIVKLLKVGNIDDDTPAAENDLYNESLVPVTDSPGAPSALHPLSRSDRSWSFPLPLRRDSFNIQSNDFVYSLLFLVFLGLAGVKGIDFVSRNYA